MKLYVGNATKQNHDFLYRVPETNGVRKLEIPIGGQCQVPGDLDRQTIDYIVGQHTRYGLVTADEVGRTPHFAGLCYSIDRPLKVDNIAELIDRNTDFLVERGKQIRQESAIQANEAVETGLGDHERPETLRTLELSVVEENHDDRDETPAVAEGVRVQREPGDQAPQRYAPKRRR